MRIEEIDKNFKTENSCGRDDVVFINCLEKPFKVCGVFMEDGFVRMPQKVADATNEGVAMLNKHTAGGRVRFKTDSPFVAVKVKMREVGKMPHFPLTGSVGFDLYTDERYINTFIPPFDVKDQYEAIVNVGGKGTEKQITLNMPLYSGITELQIGLQAGSTLSEPDDYKHTVPVVYYGSSITQGGCAARPGNSYEAMISRFLDCDYVNLGFSGSAKAEESITEYISDLEMSVFVYDYDHNAPTWEHLENTHEKMFRRIREKQPDLPIVFVTRPVSYEDEDSLTRKAIIRKTYDNAVAGGDEKVYFVDGGKFFLLFDRDSCTVDNCHPTDLGFACMAKVIGDVLDGILNGK